MPASDFADLMHDTVLVALRTGINEYGEATYGADASVTARVAARIRMVRDHKGNERVSTGTVWLAEATGIEPVDRITLPDGTQPEILAVGRVADETGAVYETVYT